jgi:acyl dehydratase
MAGPRAGSRDSITETALGSSPGVRTMRYFEDLSEGKSFELGEYTLTREEAVSFASRWDPQPFHLDEAGAADTVFDGLVASGLHTLCIAGKLFAEGFVNDVANMGGRGMGDIRWPRPVTPEETLVGRVRVARKGEPTRPERGDVAFELTLSGQDGDLALSTTFRNIVRRRG